MKKQEERTEQTTASKPGDDLSELVKRALQQPGVRELMEVYQKWSAFDLVSRQNRHATSVKWIISASNTSTSGLL